MKEIPLSFYIFSSLVLFLINYISFRVFALVFSKNYTYIFGILLLAMLGFEIYFMINLRGDLTRGLYIFCASLIGLSFMMFMLSLVYMIIFTGTSKAPISLQRRDAIIKIFNIFTLFAFLYYTIAGFWGGFKEASIKRVKVRIKNLKKPLHIVHITDVHIGKILQHDFLEQVVLKINSLKPDLVAITGDLIDLEIEKCKDFLEPLKSLQSRYGTYFVVGNHEYYHGVEEIIEHLKSIGVNVLENENMQVGEVNIAGIYDFDAKRLKHRLLPDLDLALKGVDGVSILLSHQPKVVNYLTSSQRVDLVLSGHTHGGQIFPFGFLVSLVQPYLHGLYRHNEHTQIYVSSGVGFWGPPIRFLAPAEIVSLKLY